MFKKKPNIKTLSPLRSSDRRRIADNIISSYQIAVPSRDVDNEEEKATATAALTALRNSILPDNSLSAKFTTTLGSELKQVAGTVYVGSYGSHEQRILWFSVDDHLYPSVYSLWSLSLILPLLHTPSVVVQKIQGGSDLMTPGLAGPPFPAGATRGATAAVASIENPTVPMAVGVCEIDISALNTTSGVKGHAFKPLHWAGDTIWDWSTSGRAGQKPPEHLEGWAQPTDSMVDQAKALTIDEDGDDGGVTLPAKTNGASSELPENSDSQMIDNSEQTKGGGEAETEEMSTQDIDAAFRQAFLFGVHNQKSANPSKPKYGLVFPLNQSFVMSNLVLPFLPTFTQKQAEFMVIKKTSHKNARKFIKSLDKEKLLLAKDRGSNEVDVLDIDFDDRAFQSFVPYRLPQKASKEEKGSTKSTVESSDDSTGQRLRRVELFRPKEKLASALKISQTGSSTYFTANEIRQYVTSYIESENLVEQANKRNVKLDPVLANTFFTPGKHPDTDILAKGSTTRDVLFERALSLSSPFHIILRNDETVEKSKMKPKPGSVPKIEIIMETRSGNKTVTRVIGLEPYFIGPQALADELRKACASSTSVEPSKSGKGLEVMVQGPQKDSVIELLEKRGVNKTWTTVADKAKKKK